MLDGSIIAAIITSQPAVNSPTWIASGPSTGASCWR